MKEGDNPKIIDAWAGKGYTEMAIIAGGGTIILGIGTAGFVVGGKIFRNVDL